MPSSNKPIPRIEIAMGAMVHLDVPGMSERLSSTLIGVDPGEMVVVKGWRGLTSSSAQVLKGKTVVLRYLHAGSVYGFSARVLIALAAPRRCLILEYPQRVEEHNLRQNRRAACNLPCTVVREQGRHAGIISDISEAGCRAQIYGIAEETTFAIGERVKLETQFPGSPGSYELVGEVRNTTADSDRHALGMRFIPLDDRTRDAVAKYVRELGL